MAKQTQNYPANENVPTVSVVGAGLMGASIAVALASSGIPVKVKEIDDAALANGMKNIDGLFKRMIDKGLSLEDAANRTSLIEAVHSYEELNHVDFVIEAVHESLAVKSKVFEQLDAVCDKECILASNTSSLSITQIASFTNRPERVIGMHFFNPAHVMKLVEVIPGVRTSNATVHIAIALGIRLGKLAVKVEECPSFLVNRLLSRYLNEALWLTQEKKATVEEIDEAACRLLMPLGPLALRDMNGLDIGLAVARFNFQEYGERFRPPPILEKMVEANMLGRKTLAGFYTYDGKTRKATSVNPEFLGLLNSINPDKVGRITESDSLRLFLPMINEAFIALQEKICWPDDLDPALKAGLGMRKGPLEFAFEIGLANCLKQIEHCFEQYGERFRPAQLLKRFVWAGKTSLS